MNQEYRIIGKSLATIQDIVITCVCVYLNVERISNADGENSKRDSKNRREVTGESESEEEEEEEANKKRVRERERRGNIEWMEEKS